MVKLKLNCCFTRGVKHRAKQSKISHETIQYRSFAKFDENMFLSKLDENLASLKIEGTNTEEHFANWTNTILNTLNNHAPIKQKRVKRCNQSKWYNGNIKDSQRKRDYYHRLKDWKNYKIWRNHTKTEIDKSKRAFYNNCIQNEKDTSPSKHPDVETTLKQCRTPTLDDRWI